MSCAMSGFLVLENALRTASVREEDTLTKKIWREVEHYYEDLLVKPDPRFARILATSRDAGLPAINVTPGQGKFLQLLVRLQKAGRVLEIGTLGGYSTAWLAQGLPPDGLLITIEIDPDYAELAGANLSEFEFAGLIDIRVGDAIHSLKSLSESRVAPFDLIFLDADKTQYCEYLEWSLKLSHPGTLIVADNIVREGEIIKEDSGDPKVQAVREFNRRVAGDSGLRATALQTVGSKGYDGFCLIYVDAPDQNMS